MDGIATLALTPYTAVRPSAGALCRRHCNAGQRAAGRISWPMRPFVRLRQAVHYHASRFSVAGADADSAIRALERMPSSSDYRSALFRGRQASRAMLRRMALKTARVEYTRFLSLCTEWRSDNPVVHRALALGCTQILGPQPSAQAALAKVRQAHRYIHPDKISPGLLDSYQQNGCEKLHEMISLLHNILSDQVYAQAIYTPGRLHYGQTGGPQAAVVGALSAIVAGGSIFFYQTCQDGQSSPR